MSYQPPSDSYGVPQAPVLGNNNGYNSYNPPSNPGFYPSGQIFVQLSQS